MADDISWVFPAHRIRALVTGTSVAQTALEPLLHLGQEGAIDLGLFAAEVPPALVLGHLAHQSGDGEAGCEDLLDDADDRVVDALVAELADGRLEGHPCCRGPPGLSHAAGEALGARAMVDSSIANAVCGSLAADRVWQRQWQWCDRLFERGCDRAERSRGWVEMRRGV